MQILPINPILNIFQPKIKSRNGLLTTPMSKDLECDTFERSENISFKSGTSAGNVFRRYKRIKCPYFQIEMLTGSEVNHAENLLDKCNNIKEFVSVLYKYRKNMPETEKKMYKRFAEYSKIKPKANLQDCLKLWYDEAITKLKLEEFKVLDDVDRISMKMTPKHALDVHAQTTWCRQTILENNKENTFKRKHLLNSLGEIVVGKNDRKILQELQERALYLPTSVTSENAFVVKYADRTQHEIAKRLIRSAYLTIEHIRPNSLEGENKIENFMPTCAAANNLRSNLPLDKFIQMFPKIPRNCQKFVNQIIEILNKGGMRGNETYPYEVRKTLLYESKGLINLDLSKYNLSKNEAKMAELRYAQRFDVYKNRKKGINN